MDPTRRRIAARAAALAAAALAWTSAHAAAPDVGDRVRHAAARFAALEQAEVDALSSELDRLVADPALVKPFVARDRAKLLAVAAPRFEKVKAERHVTHWYFLDPEPTRICFLRVHAPTLHGDFVARATLSMAIATQQVGYGKELGKTAFALRVVKPIRSGGKVVGYMELGEEIDHFLDRMKRETGDDFGILADKKLVDRAELARVRNDDRWDERPDVVLIDSTMWDERHIGLGMPLAKLPASGALVRGWKESGRSYSGGAFPVKDASGSVVGALFVRHEVKE